MSEPRTVKDNHISSYSKSDDGNLGPFALKRRKTGATTLLPNKICLASLMKQVECITVHTLKLFTAACLPRSSNISQHILLLYWLCGGISVNTVLSNPCYLFELTTLTAWPANSPQALAWLKLAQLKSWTVLHQINEGSSHCENSVKNDSCL